MQLAICADPVETVQVLLRSLVFPYLGLWVVDFLFGSLGDPVRFLLSSGDTADYVEPCLPCASVSVETLKLVVEEAPKGRSRH